MRISSGTITHFLLVSMGMLLATTSLFANRIYVHATASGANNGTSWTDAFTDLQSALSSSIIDDTIWVAAGTYKPTSTADRTISFVLNSGVKILGGFNGTESSESQRNPLANICNLSGDIGTGGVPTDNSYTVVKSTNVTNATVLDGFRIISGNHTDATMIYTGAGLINNGGSPQIRNCVFTGNTAGSGGAIMQMGTSNMTLLNCVFAGNIAAGPSTISGGGAIYITGGIINVSQCVFTSNNGRSGGAIQLNGGQMRIDRSVISGNTANNTGGAIYGYQADFTLTLTNSLVVGNYSGTYSAMYIASSPSRSHKVVNCTVAHNYSALNGLISAYFNTSSTVTNSIFVQNTEATQVEINNGLVSNTIVLATGQNPIGGAVVDPLFVNPGSATLAPFLASDYDYSLQTLSPAIDFSLASNLITGYDQYDLTGAPRVFGAAPDAGCFEKNFCPFVPYVTISNPNGICPGGSVTLSVDPSVDVVWSTNSTSNSITVNTPGEYSLQVDSAGCLGIGSITVNALNPQVVIVIDGDNDLCPGETVTLSATGGDFIAYQWNNGVDQPSQVVSIGGVYNVTITDSNGCSVSNSVTVVTHNNPNITISGDPEICAGEQTTLSVSGAGNLDYFWLTGGQTTSSISVNTAGNYAVIATDAYGCQSQESITVSLAASPTALITENGGTLSTGSYVSYQWYLNGSIIPNATQFYYIPTVNGVYTVEVTNSAGCSAQSAPFNFTGIGVNEITAAHVISYPNPVEDLLTIEAAQFNASERVIIEVYNVFGQMVQTKTYSPAAVIRLEMTHLPSGSYLIRWRNGEEQRTLAVVKTSV